MFRALRFVGTIKVAGFALRSVRACFAASLVGTTIVSACSVRFVGIHFAVHPVGVGFDRYNHSSCMFCREYSPSN